MSERFERLQEARRSAGYASASDAAAAIGAKLPTYIHHENGTRDFSRGDTVERYARFFRVNLEWLLTGRGAMRALRPPEGATIPVDGLVGAGASVEMIGDPEDVEGADAVVLPTDGTLGALRVRGDSQWPRFLDGEIVIYDRRPVTPASLVGRLAIVQTVDGRRLIKTLRRGRSERVWRLESHNAPPEDDVQLIGAWRYIGTLAEG